LFLILLTAVIEVRTAVLLSLRPKLVELDKTVKVGAVSYLNTKPLLYGWKHGYEIAKAELIEAYPAKVAEMLLNDEIDVGLVPVAIIPRLKEAHIVTGYCIGAEGPVASVCLFSEVPIEKIERVLLDYQSRTSIALAQVLMKNYWKIAPVVEPATEDFRDHIKGTTAAVVIGDRAFEQRLQSTYVYDLAEAWKAFTGLPFVFAAWVANKKLPAEFIDAFNASNSVGLSDLQSVVDENPYTKYDLLTYFKHNISYELTDEKRKGLDLFLDYLQQSSIP
jgi:chorismate dehydratase